MRRIFHGKKLTWDCPVGSNAVSCSSLADAIIDFFCCIHRRSDPMLFNNSKNCPFPWGSRPHPIHGSLSPPELPTQMASSSVHQLLHGSWTWSIDRQTDRQTDRLHYSVCSNRLHIVTAATRHNKSSSEDEIANVNVLRRHRTCRDQSLCPLNWVPKHLCTYAHQTELSEFVLPE